MICLGKQKNKQPNHQRIQFVTKSSRNSSKQFRRRSLYFSIILENGKTESNVLDKNMFFHTVYIQRNTFHMNNLVSLYLNNMLKNKFLKDETCWKLYAFANGYSKNTLCCVYVNTRALRPSVVSDSLQPYGLQPTDRILQARILE